MVARRAVSEFIRRSTSPLHVGQMLRRAPTSCAEDPPVGDSETARGTATMFHRGCYCLSGPADSGLQGGARGAYAAHGACGKPVAGTGRASIIVSVLAGCRRHYGGFPAPFWPRPGKTLADALVCPVGYDPRREPPGDAGEPTARRRGADRRGDPARAGHRFLGAGAAPARPGRRASGPRRGGLPGQHRGGGHGPGLGVADVHGRDPPRGRLRASAAGRRPRPGRSSWTCPG